MKKDTLASLFLIRLRFGAGGWRAQDVRALGAPPRIATLHNAGYIERVDPRSTARPIEWRLTSLGIQASQTPARRTERGLWPLEYSERLVWAAWRTAGAGRFLRRDVPSWARPATLAPHLLLPVGPGPHPNSLYWRLTVEGVALAERLDAELVEQWGPEVWPPTVPVPEPAPAVSCPEPPAPAPSTSRERRRARCLAYYYAHREEINARKRAKYAAEKTRGSAPSHSVATGGNTGTSYA